MFFFFFFGCFLLEMKAIGSFSKSWQIDDSWFFTAFFTVFQCLAVRCGMTTCSFLGHDKTPSFWEKKHACIQGQMRYGRKALLLFPLLN